MEPTVKKFAELHKGDVIRMRIPFEENTSDYYNGYTPKEIRGGVYRDRFGDTSKPRFIVVMGRENDNILYLPLTSRHSGFDSQHQYTLQDNSMTWKRDENMKSYVECHALRAVRANPDWDIQTFGHITENDMINIMIKVGEKRLDLSSKRDQRVYVSKGKSDLFEAWVVENGFEPQRDMNQYTKIFVHSDGRTIEKQKWGLVRYHVPLSKEEVAKLVAIREGRPEDEFTKAVADITKKTAKNESEVTQ